MEIFRVKFRFSMLEGRLELYLFQPCMRYRGTISCSSYDGSFSVVSYACASLFYDAFSFYRKACPKILVKKYVYSNDFIR